MLPENHVVLYKNIPHLKLINIQIFFTLGFEKRRTGIRFQIKDLIDLSLNSVGNSLWQPISENCVHNLDVLKSIKRTAVKDAQLVAEVLLEPRQNARGLSDQSCDPTLLREGGTCAR